MKKSGLLLILLLSCTIGSIISAQGKKQSFPFFFVQLTDPQFGFFENNRGFAQETALYEKAIDAINRIKPDFVVITGDLVNDKSDEGQWAEFNRITAEINSSIPVYLTPGNHDIGQSSDKTEVDKYINRCGYDRFSFKHSKCRFIGLNSCIIKTVNNDLEKELWASLWVRHLRVSG